MTNRNAKRRPVAVLLVLSFASAPFATALAGEAEDRATARELAKQGLAAWSSGDCATVIDRFERAESHFHAPLHLQYLARCYVKGGRLVEAAETWRRLAREPIDATTPPVARTAIAEAKVELPKIEPRLGRITIAAAEAYSGLVVKLDGSTFSTAGLGVSRVVNPGSHIIAATAPSYEPFEQPLPVKEGENEKFTIKLTPEPVVAPSATQPPASSASAAPAASVVAPPPIQQPERDDHGSGWRAFGIAAAGVGGALLLTGVATGLAAQSKFKSIEDACYKRHCPPTFDLEGEKSSVKNFQMATNILLVGGGVLAAVGITAFIVSPTSNSSSRTVGLSIRPSAYGGHVEVGGSF